MNLVHHAERLRLFGQMKSACGGKVTEAERIVFIQETQSRYDAFFGDVDDREVISLFYRLYFLTEFLLQCGDDGFDGDRRVVTSCLDLEG